MNELDKLLNAITPQIYDNLQQSIAIGRWPDGRKLSTQQLQLSLQLIIAYDNRHKSSEQHTGAIGNAQCPSKNGQKKPVPTNLNITAKNQLK